MLKYVLFWVSAWVIFISGGATILYLARAIWDLLGTGKYFAATFFIAVLVGFIQFMLGWGRKPVSIIKPEVSQIEPNQLNP